MATRSSQIDRYIANAQPFARPILRKIRTLFHRACPQVEEKLKWSVPSFEYKGIVGGMAAFKQHVSWGLWKAALIQDPTGAMKSDASSAMGGGKLQSTADLPPDNVMIDLIKQAADLNERGVKLPSRSTQARRRPPPKTPTDLAAALKSNRKAADTFARFSPSNKRDYIEWLTEAKQDATRKRRLAQAIEWIAQGKPRNWKYMR